MTTWKTDRSGLSAATQYLDGSVESRLLSTIPPTDTILPADPLTSTELRAVIQDQISLMEYQELLPRVAREGLLLTMETFGGMQGITPDQIYATNIAYRKTKDFDNAIVALRAQMEAIV